MVGQFEFGPDGKVAKKIQESVVSLIPDASIFMTSLDVENEKYALISTISYISANKCRFHEGSMRTYLYRRNI